MNRRIRNRLQMLRNTLDHFDQHPDLWNDAPPLARNVEAVRATADAIAAAGKAQAEGDTTGLTDDKLDARDDAATALRDLGRKVSAYAIEADDDDLRAAVDRSHSDWIRMADATFEAQAARALTRIEGLPAEVLTEYRVGADEIEAARRLVGEVARLTTRRDATGDAGATATESLDTRYQALLSTLAVVDRLVPTFIDDEAFVAQYRIARRIPGD